MKKTVLINNWELKKIDSTKHTIDQILTNEIPAYPVAKMPMQVCDVLLDQGVIELPWKSGLAKEYQWIGESDWAYVTSFFLPEDFAPPYRLICEGLDLFAEIYINGERAASHENALYPLRTSLPNALLHSGQVNTMAVLLRSTAKQIMERTSSSGEMSLAQRARILNLRKNLNDFTSYLGQKPYFVRMGIFGDISIISEDCGIIEQAELSAQINQTMDRGYLKVSCQGIQSAATMVFTVRDPQDAILTKFSRPISDEQFCIEECIEIPNPQLWYPAGYGSHPLYTVEVQMVSDTGILDSRSWKTGFRKLEMTSPLHFRINGNDVKLYGGNWAPLSAVTECWDEERAQKLLQLTAQGNFNALRIWSCGSIVPDCFYDTCDELGLLIWQDFYLPYTGESVTGRENNLIEADYLIQRIGHHPGLVLWCGGNESMSFYQWNHDGAPMPGREVLEYDLRKLCEQKDPSRYYLPESPYGGYDNNDPRVWDTHGYTNYSYVPGYEHLNFASEDFRISSPPLRSLRKFMPEEDIWPEDYQQVHKPGDICEVPDSWLNYNSNAESELKYGPLWDYYDATDGESMIHRVNIAASNFYRSTIERLRRGRPSGISGDDRCCGGYLVWKLNDSWPQIYGAKIDYFLEPTMPYYFLKRAYEPIQVSFDIGEFIHVWVINDSPVDIGATLRVKLYHMTENRVVKEVIYPISVSAGKSLDVADLTESFGTFRRQNILFAQLVDPSGCEIARTTQVVGVERYLQFPKATLQLRQINDEIEITTDYYAHCIYMEGDDNGDTFGWQFDDNYFSLVPGECKRIHNLGLHKTGTITAKEFYSKVTSSIRYDSSKK